MSGSRILIIRAVDIFIEVIKYLIIARIFAGILFRDRQHPIMSFLYQITEPILEPFRKLIYKFNINTGMFDFSPLLAFLFLEIIENLIIRMLY
ncbi:YggT family protein [Abyssisolibacter fermentans]|uniref:YggT family protein n=1 Tax=Abyssisolibacter fermentans TaxID=1766203 RepID=UPI00082D2EC3|nr:YggT family protein [Abyssisolibacter fermentans]